ncbi:hypothetical protein [Acidianus manzaensis]|uniref:Uncharacterized protein n=1 Tax=Acidianus manzaensis TaxID=282676 RepID=A0A1W6JX55_9CREN|nr:hypothetical protein [Acidianus manzaensis]ARM74829.1 hypothetical protein B6F84_01500 [Acidianus manzaensis]
MKIGGFILAIGIAILSLGILSINTHVDNTFTLTSKPLEINVPTTARAYINIIENATNVSAYVIISHDGNNYIVKAPYTLILSHGSYKFKTYEEGYFIKTRKIVNETETLPCGNVTVQKVINQTTYITTHNLTYPVYVHLTIYKMNIVENKTITQIIGAILLILGLALTILERFNFL